MVRYILHHCPFTLKLGVAQGLSHGMLYEMLHYFLQVTNSFVIRHL
jgi:hypothetical protein